MFIVKGNLNGLMKQEQLILFDHIHLYTLVLYSNYIEKKEISSLIRFHLNFHQIIYHCINLRIYQLNQLTRAQPNLE